MTATPRAVLRCATVFCLTLVAVLPHALARPDPLNPLAEVPEMRPPAVLTRQRVVTMPPLASWRDANDTVTRVGGWKAYLREAQRPASAPRESGERENPDAKR